MSVIQWGHVISLLCIKSFEVREEHREWTLSLKMYHGSKARTSPHNLAALKSWATDMAFPNPWGFQRAMCSRRLLGSWQQRKSNQWPSFCPKAASPKRGMCPLALGTQVGPCPTERSGHPWDVTRRCLPNGSRCPWCPKGWPRVVIVNTVQNYWMIPNYTNPNSWYLTLYVIVQLILSMCKLNLNYLK